MRTLNYVTTACFSVLLSAPRKRPRAQHFLVARARGALGRRHGVSSDALRHGGRAVTLVGLSYSIVHAPAATVLVALSNVENLPQALPRTKSARLIDVRGAEARVELVQGKGALRGLYTVCIERVPGRSELRFWLDPSRPHDIEDVFGFFRVEPFGEGKSLVTVAAALNLGSGFASLFFSDAIERTVLSAPRQIRDYVEPHGAYCSL